MGDPELRSDEKVLVRTPGVYVKSIPFEGILTNRRIILIDRAKNLLPPKEIPLITIKEVEPGENAIRDQIITLSVMAKTGEIRQMILTFSRQAGGNRIKERDAWARIIKEYASTSFDQVIRNVIPGPEPAPRRAEPAAGPRYEVVHSRPQQATPSEESRLAGTTRDDMSPVRRPVATSPVAVVPVSPGVSQYDASPRGASIFCSKCGNKVPAESVFCNRCGSPIAQTLTISTPVQPQAAPPVVKTPVARPIDEDIQSIEPLIEPSSVKIPADALRASSIDPTLRPSLSWDDKEKPEPASLPAEKIPGEKPADAVTAVPSHGSTSDSPPPPKPPRGSSFIPDTRTLLTAAGVIAAILIVAAGAFFIYPMLTAGETTIPGGETTTPVTSTTTRPVAIGTIIPYVPATRPIPTTGVFIHVNYLGGFEGSYGLPDALTTVPGNSGDRVWEVENANGTVQAEFVKQDGSARELMVEIYKDGKSLTSGITTIGHGSVALSVNLTTGIAAAPVTSGGGTTKTAAAVTSAADTTTATTILTTAVASTTTAAS
ncbi:MAG: zinc-ribbon domain-containing protein [Methanoregulaceae archaeon]|nr:MAG: zinc-ribbon domain-containing protein [Methanoregulaceae archaeon]